MCGIAGFLRSCVPDGDEGTLAHMGDAIRHRGPDAGGTYLDEYVGLAHRRLSIIDLSTDGNQPMRSPDGRFVIAFNGEVYNFPALRLELERKGRVFRSRTDTEVVLAMFESEGIACLDRLNGMFAFAVWDRRERTLFLVRDRIGKKPLYYYLGGSDRLAFASEIKSILTLPGIPREIEPTSIVDYLKYLYIHEPKTIYKNIFKLPPAHYLEVREGTEPRICEYWDVDFSRKTAYFREEDAVDDLLELLKDSTRARMIADVPLGAFLSGGIDSSAVVALMSRCTSKPVRTCTIGFEDREHDEAPYAREIAAAFRTDHREHVIREDLAKTILLLPKYFDEPFADSSAVPTYHVSRLARNTVTVALAGDGADESFGGYEKYIIELREDLARRYVPGGLLRFANRCCRDLPGSIMRKARTLTGSALADPGRAYYATNTFIRDDDLHLLLSDRIRSCCAGYDPAWHTLRFWDRVRDADHVTRMLYTDLKSYLPGDILVKVDRMSMAHSLEVRAPFLDYRVIEFAASLPSRWKIRGKSKKHVLKGAFRKILPGGTLRRKKHGFTVPLDRWFRQELRTITEESLLRNGYIGEYFSESRLAGIWQEHQSGRKNHGTLLWSLLNFALWHDAYIGAGNGEGLAVGSPRAVTAGQIADV